MEIPQHEEENLLQFLEECGGNVCEGKSSYTLEGKQKIQRIIVAQLSCSCEQCCEAARIPIKKSLFLDVSEEALQEIRESPSTIAN